MPGVPGDDNISGQWSVCANQPQVGMVSAAESPLSPCHCIASPGTRGRREDGEASSFNWIEIYVIFLFHKLKNHK